MDSLINELGLSQNNLFESTSPNIYTTIVHSSWLKKWLKNSEVDKNVNNSDFVIHSSESVPYPWKKIFIQVISKKVSKVLPLPRYKLNEGNTDPSLTFPQMLRYISQNNQRNLWKESYKNHNQDSSSNKESAIVNLLEHDLLLNEIILRLYGCNIIKIKSDGTGKVTDYNDILSNRNLSKSYETHVNLLAAMFTLETDNNFYIIHRGHYEYNMLHCLNFSPALIETNYGRGLFILYQLITAAKAVNDRGLILGNLKLEDIYLTDNLWIQIIPPLCDNIHFLDQSLISESTKFRHISTTNTQSPVKKEDDCSRRDLIVQLEKLCLLWVQGRISNLDYLIHINKLASRTSIDPQSHYIVPWVTDFSSRCGRNWRDMSKSKYRLNKGDRQLDMTYEVTSCADQIPHHVSDPLTDITCYVYLARRMSRDVLCKYVRNKWVPAEYPSSIQRMQEWTPDECIPEFYSDPSVFKSIHEDLPDLGIPSWASCVEDFITKHREALESAHVSEHLHHWIDITFGYKLSGPASIKAKNVSLSLADGHTSPRRSGPLRLFPAPHPARNPRAMPSHPLAMHYTMPRERKIHKQNESSEDISDDEEDSTSLSQHVSRPNVPSHRTRRHKSSNRARSLSKPQDESGVSTTERASSHSRHYRVQKSELGKGVIYLPKEFNPVASLLALESFDNFRTKCFFSKAEDSKRVKDDISSFSLYPMQNDIRANDHKEKADTAFTNHMFLATYEHNYFKKFSPDTHLENAFKDRKNKSLNTRYTTDASVYKQIVTESRRKDLMVIGCLIVEIFLHKHMRPLRMNNNNFLERYSSCRTVLKYNFNCMPKCVSYMASLLLNVDPPSLSFVNPLSTKSKADTTNKIVITGKGLPPPTPSQLLQPLLMQHLIPFPQTFVLLHKLLSTLHEYELTSNELNILYMYECNGVQCENYQNLDKTKTHFSQKIAEGKIQASVTHLDVLLNQTYCNSQFDFMDIFLTHYIELLNNKSTSVLAAWYLFDIISKHLGPATTRAKLLKHILNLYDDDDLVTDKSDSKHDEESSLTNTGASSKQKFVKLYHNMFLLQLMVRLGLQCFLENFTEHLVEAVGGYKDVAVEVGSPGHLCYNRSMANRKPKFSDDNVKNVIPITTDIFSPDTSYGSENVITPNIEKKYAKSEEMRERDNDSRSENELFHFESDKERIPSCSRSKSPTESVDSYTLNTNKDLFNTPSPSAEVFSPSKSQPFPKSPMSNDNVSIKVTTYNNSESKESQPRGAMSPTIEIPYNKTGMFTSYLHFADDNEESNSEDYIKRPNSHRREIKSLDLRRHSDTTRKVINLNDDTPFKDTSPCKISDVAYESLIWLANRLGPVLTCRYITKNLLKMLTLCYIGKENLTAYDGEEKDDFDNITIAHSKVVGDRNASKVINCLTSIVEMYGEQLVIFQYLAHMGELIASCRRRVSGALEGGVVACLQLLARLLPCLPDARLVEQLQDTFLKTIIQPALRLSASGRCAYPNGALARKAVCRKLVDSLYAVALRIGPEMTRTHLCPVSLSRFFLAFDKAHGKTENWPKQEDDSVEKSDSALIDSGGFLELRRDGSTAEWAVRGGRAVRADLPDHPCSPPQTTPFQPRPAQEELLAVFNEELAYQAYTAFTALVGTESLDKCIKNLDTIQSLVQKYEASHNISSKRDFRNRFQSSFSDEPIGRKAVDITPTKPDLVMDHISSSNSFGSNVTLVGNRIDIAGEPTELSQSNRFQTVACKMDNGRSNRHLRGDWLIYWEHEIGRPEKEERFNLKQIKLQTFMGHTHSIKSIHCLDNENSFMSGSKDKTVKLWSLRNQGDGNATTQCNWTYTGHKKGVLSLTFLESSRLAVSTDSVVHIWDPFMEAVVSQLEHIKNGISVVRTWGHNICAATSDSSIRIIDPRAVNSNLELKLGSSPGAIVRCMAVDGVSGEWVACGLASGYVLVLQPRTGQTLAHWKAHDAEVLRLAVVDKYRLLSSGLDQVTALWRVDDGELIAHLKGTTEPVHCLSVFYKELISGTTNNRIGVHTSIDKEASFSSTKLRSDTFKGVLTCMSVLPLNRLLLLGSDNGTISLLC